MTMPVVTVTVWLWDLLNAEISLTGKDQISLSDRKKLIGFKNVSGCFIFITLTVACFFSICHSKFSFARLVHHRPYHIHEPECK
jgi:hypothetical protein